MRRFPLPAALAALALLSAPAGAAAGSAPMLQDETGLSLSARVGWAVPFGKAEGGGPDLSSTYEGKLPIWIELGYRFGPHLAANLFLELAPVTLASGACPAGAACSAADVRFGLDLQLHPSPAGRFDPWLGVGVGLEFLNEVVDQGGAERETRLGGLELPLLEAGLDVAVAPRLSVGPYVSASFAWFTSVAVREGGVRRTFDVEDRALHGWLQAGLRATIKL